ncbi:glycerophosphodiester phosphodiesterase [Ornithinimicrobium tianjinense]|uniref:glycerophosphodiester phosphodiesterase n=1 Tax=Ornithinimicrobium tianjinense TaxID=1195761 RepID=A0A917F469_9MICO|nr:glycerophosphodiester phosphodiesterase [Ornithinimicrobium tianjinense]GGF44390.1 glycerophosphoryl diester phosphodiesterase [Ornithinimicrobium tianjinense]
MFRPVARLAAVACLAMPLALSGAAAGATPGQGADHGLGLGPKADTGAPTTAPLVVGHRGASGYRPEHTLASYELAARMGADFIEPDLVATKDGVLVARHENLINDTTDVALHPEFADRKTTKMIDGVALTGWFTEDFTLAELKTLRAKERLPQVRPANTAYDGQFEVPTFEEVLELRERLSAELGREIGVYPETKHPSYFDGLGLSLDEPLVGLLEQYGLNKPQAPVFVQSFELANLADLNTNLKLRAPSVFLLWHSGYPWDSEVAGDTVRDYAHYTTPEGLREIVDAQVDGVGPEMTMVISREADGSMGADTGLVDRAHDARLTVHPYTMRAENTFLYTDFRSSADPIAHGDMIGQITAMLEVGVDGFFTDQPDLGRQAVDAWMSDKKVRPQG